ncbi:unnamed protein product [Angiostrongylus costaricensis]|uniref:Uncharacterized protein n=1 Tax=Angiostrongylus costaricensis TaxID=334426 RepID=A0A0R3PKK2_ANGCS|nr:unnamed protein product [Angiostrongylus costaricensis]
MKLQTEAHKPDWSKETGLTVDCPHQAANTRTGAVSDEKPNLGVRIVDTAKSVARQLWEKYGFYILPPMYILSFSSLFR